MRTADLIIFLIDTTRDEKEQFKTLYKEFDKAQIKLNAQSPKIKIQRAGQGGIGFLGKKFFQFSVSDAKKLLNSYGYHNAVVSASDVVTIEDLADALNESVSYQPLVVIYTKGDLSGRGVSPVTGKGMSELKEKIFKALHIIRVYTKTPGKEKDWPPVALKKGATVKTLAGIIHKDFYKKFKFARVWGKSAKHEGMKAGLGHILEDQDVVEFHVK